MSARRVAWFLTAAIVLVVFAIWLSSRRHLERSIVAGELVLPGLEHNVNAVNTVRLRKANDVHTTLDKGGDVWSVAERGWPADLSKVRKLLLNLGALNIVEEKTRLPSRYPDLGVEDVSQPKADGAGGTNVTNGTPKADGTSGTPKTSGTRVEVVTAAKTWALIVGKSSSAKSGYVRVADARQALLAAPLLSVDADPKTWLDQTLIDLPAARVKQIEEKPGQGPSYTASRDKKEDSNFAVTPLPKGRVLTGPAAAESIAGALGGLTLDDVHKGGSADAAAAHAVFHTFDGLDVDVAGRKDSTHSLVTISARSTAPATAAEAQKLNSRLAGWEFEIADYKYSAIFTPLEELLQKPPEPAKKKAGASHPTTGK
jgi:Domain of unknown function (DUF4340)